MSAPASARTLLALVAVLAVLAGGVLWLGAATRGGDEPASEAVRGLAASPRAEPPSVPAAEFAETSEAPPQRLAAAEPPAVAAAAVASADTALVRGRVLAGGRPVPRAQIEVRQDGGNGALGLKVWEPLVADGYGSFSSAFDADATIELRASDGVAESDWVAVATQVGAEFEVTLDLVEPYVLRGHVLDAEGQPQQGAIVQMLSADPADRADDLDVFGMPVLAAGTEADGAFEIRVRRAGRYAVSAKLNEHRMGEQEVLLDDLHAELDITLQPGPEPSGH